MIRLSSCPFCGGSKSFVGETLDRKWYATCERDHCAFVGHFDTEAEAIIAWNTRPSSIASLTDAPDAVREAAQFLSDRLDDLDWSTGLDALAKNYSGHVDPAHSRLKGALTTPPAKDDAGRLREAKVRAILEQGRDGNPVYRQARIIAALAALSDEGEERRG